MVFINNHRANPPEEQNAYIAQGRISLLERANNHCQLIGLNPSVGRPPIDASIQARNHNRLRSYSAKILSEAALHLCRECAGRNERSEEHTSELQSLMRISYAVFCLKKKTITRKKERESAV